MVFHHLLRDDVIVMIDKAVLFSFPMAGNFNIHGCVSRYISIDDNVFSFCLSICFLGFIN